MPRYRLVLEYDGGPYVGWQRQDNGSSVQAALEDAVLGFAGECVSAVAAGRTDAGVHALGQVAHIDLTKDWPPATVADALNAHLRPQPIAVLGAEVAAADFHARFSATARRYRYRIVNRRAPLGLDRGHAWHVIKALDAGAMQRAAQTLVGPHDFTTFRSVHCQARSAVKTLSELGVRREGDVIVVTARARSFLHNQVRAIVGTLELVGEGKWPAEAVARALAARDRAACGPTAPACGLYLDAVEYDRAGDAPGSETDA